MLKKLKESPSIRLTVSKPFSWFVILLGAFSLFNLARDLFDFELAPIVLPFNISYEFIRDVVVIPIEWVLGTQLPTYVKNGFVIYLTMGRSYSLAFGAIRESISPISFRLTSGGDVTSNTYPPIDGPVLKHFIKWEKWVVGHSAQLIQTPSLLVANFLASLLWPVPILVLLKEPTVSKRTDFNENNSVITEQGVMADKATRDAHHATGNKPIPKMTGGFLVPKQSRIRSDQTMGANIPKGPEPVFVSMFNARVIILSFLIMQLLTVAVLLSINGIGLVLVSPSTP